MSEKCYCDKVSDGFICIPCANSESDTVEKIRRSERDVLKAELEDQKRRGDTYWDLAAEKQNEISKLKAELAMSDDWQKCQIEFSRLENVVGKYKSRAARWELTAARYREALECIHKNPKHEYCHCVEEALKEAEA